MRYTLIFFGCLISGCTSLPKIKQPSSIDTMVLTQSYYYCEHCPESTKLEEQFFQPLEPDTPIVQDEITVYLNPFLF